MGFFSNKAACVHTGISIQESSFWRSHFDLSTTYVCKNYKCEILAQSPASKDNVFKALNKLIHGSMGRGPNQFYNISKQRYTFYFSCSMRNLSNRHSHSLLRTCIYMLHLFENEWNRPILIKKIRTWNKTRCFSDLVSPVNISANWINLKSLLKFKLMILFNNTINSYSQSTSSQHVFTCEPLSIV